MEWIATFDTSNTSLEKRLNVNNHLSQHLMKPINNKKPDTKKQIMMPQITNQNTIVRDRSMKFSDWLGVMKRFKSRDGKTIHATEVKEMLKTTHSKPLKHDTEINTLDTAKDEPENDEMLTPER